MNYSLLNRLPQQLIFTAILLSCLCAVAPVSAADGVDASKIKWKRTELDAKFRSEGVAVADFNRDGKLDIAAGSVWYAAPDWKMHLVRDKAGEFDPKNYSDSFVNFADDRNGDGWTDLLVVDFPGKETWWFENPQGKAEPWKKHVCVSVTNNESPQYLDIDGDGKRELLFATSPDPKQPDGAERFMALARPQSDPLAQFHIQQVSTKSAPGTTKYSHGIGAGDINKDGRLDILVPKGWWEAPAAKADTSAASEGSATAGSASTSSASTGWKFHSAPFGADCAHMYAYDFDGDGDNDVLSTAAHQLGMWWHEQTKEGWKTHEISKLFSQTHALMLADINGDGLPDFVTGKRYWAHGPNGDVDPGAAPLLAWFELSQKDGKPHWTPHVIDHNSGVGTQFEVVDVNNDKLLDVVISNKRGVFLFEQQRE